MSLLQDLFEIKQAGANTAFEETTKAFDDSLGTFLKFQLDSKMLDHQFNQAKVRNERDEKRDALSTFQTISQSFDNPLDKYDWLATDKARNLAIQGDAHTDESYHNFLMGESDKAFAYEEVRDWRKAFMSSDFKSRVNDYEYKDVTDMLAKAELTGDDNLVRSIKASETSFKVDVTKKHGMESANLVADWLEGGGYLDEDETKKFRDAINAGNYIGPEKQMLQIASTKLKEDSDVMQLYRLQLAKLKDLEALGIMTPEQLQSQVGALDSKFNSYWNGILSRGLPKGDLDDEPVITTTVGMPEGYRAADGYSFGEQMSQDDLVSLSKNVRGLPLNTNDMLVLTLPDDSRITADIGSGMKNYKINILRDYALKSPGNITFSNKEEDKIKSYSAFVVNQEVQGNISVPKVQLPYWKRQAVVSGTSASFNEKNKGYKNLETGQPVVDVRNGNRGNVLSFSVGDYEIVTPKRTRMFIGGTGFGSPASPEFNLGDKTVYKSGKGGAKVKVQHIYKEGDKIPKGKKVGDSYEIEMVMDEFTKRYGAPLYKLPTIQQSQGQFPGLDDSVLKLFSK